MPTPGAGVEADMLNTMKSAADMHTAKSPPSAGVRMVLALALMALALALAAWPGLLRAQTPGENQAVMAGHDDSGLFIDDLFIEAQDINGEQADLGEPEAFDEGQAGQDEAVSPIPPPIFEILGVTTGSGSKGWREEKPAIRIEIIDQTPKSPEAAAEEALAGADPGLAPDEREAQAREAALGTALALWHSRILSEYTYDIPSLKDPFMPISEVRGRPGDSAGAPYSGELAVLPPIMNLELNQLRLVAITTRTGGAAGTALAAFEDGAGVSFIMRPGDRIGRRQGRIIEITPYAVTVEEPSPGPGEPPRLTEYRLNPVDAGSLTRLGGHADEAETD